MKCEGCGSDEGNEVSCPYQQDVNNKYVIVVLCLECYKQRLQDI